VDACQRVQLQQPGASTSRTNADEMHDKTATQTPTQRRTPADTLRVGWLAGTCMLQWGARVLATASAVTSSILSTDSHAFTATAFAADAIVT